MQKYAVDENIDLDRKTCPECGKILEHNGRVLLCPLHGSRPFERSDDGHADKTK